MPLALARLRVTFRGPLFFVMAAMPDLPALYATLCAPLDATTMLVDVMLLACVKHATTPLIQAQSARIAKMVLGDPTWLTVLTLQHGIPV
jgi:hypothetical protein